MCGEGYDYTPQYSAMSGNMVGALPVGIQTCMDRDVPYWPTSTCYVSKETWVFPPARWLWIMCDLVGEIQLADKADVKRKPIDLQVTQESTADGHVTIRAKVEGTGVVPLAIRSSNLKIAHPEQKVPLEVGKPQTLAWTAEVISAHEPWVAVIVPNGDLSAKQELVGGVK
jgi:hypothetical protein